MRNHPSLNEVSKILAIPTEEIKNFLTKEEIDKYISGAKTYVSASIMAQNIASRMFEKAIDALPEYVAGEFRPKGWLANAEKNWKAFLEAPFDLQV